MSLYEAAILTCSIRSRVKSTRHTGKTVLYVLYVLGRDSSLGIATRYGLGGAGIGSRWGRDFPYPPDRPWNPTSLLHNGYRANPGGKTAGTWR